MIAQWRNTPTWLCKYTSHRMSYLELAGSLFLRPVTMCAEHVPFCHPSVAQVAGTMVGCVTGNRKGYHSIPGTDNTVTPVQS